MQVILDGRLMIDRSAVHDQLKERLNLPDYYGRNLDALFDLLTEFAEPLHILLAQWGEAEGNLGQYAETLRETLVDAANENPKLCITIEK